MNIELDNFARNWLKVKVPELSSGSQRMFKLMYGRNNGKRSVPDTEAMTIDAVVNEMPSEKLDWAMQQIINTTSK